MSSYYFRGCCGQCPKNHQFFTLRVSGSAFGWSSFLNIRLPRSLELR